MNTNEIIDVFHSELENWDWMFSDHQVAFLDGDCRIHVILENYDWYVTKDPVTTSEDVLRALFRILWLISYPEYIEDDDIWEVE